MNESTQVSQVSPGQQGPQGPGWWLASDGNWYPPQSAASSVTAAPQAPTPAAPAAPSSAGRKALLVVVAGAVAVVLLVGAVGASMFAKDVPGLGGRSSHNSAADVAQYCTDIDQAANLLDDLGDNPSPAQLKTVLSAAHRIETDAPAAVHGDAVQVEAALKAAASGHQVETPAMQAASEHEQAWNEEHCNQD